MNSDDIENVNLLDGYNFNMKFIITAKIKINPIFIFKR